MNIEVLARRPSNNRASITSDPMIHDGEACIARTGIPVWQVWHSWLCGENYAQLMTLYELNVFQVRAMWVYAILHEDEMKEDLEKHRSLVETV